MSGDRGQVFRRVLSGALLGLGAPAGYLMLASIHSGQHGQDLIVFCERFVREHSGLFVYLTFPTILAFSLFGGYTAFQERRIRRQKDQMEAFLQIAAHDIKSPLCVIREGLAISSENETDPSLVKMLMSAAARQADIMHELITELLDIHRMESGKMTKESERVDLMEVVRRAADEMAPQLDKKQGRIVWETDAAETIVCVDAFRIRQVVRNLLGNAIRYMPSESGIRVHTKKLSNRRVRVSIQNSGPAIPEDKIKTIFEKFTQSTIRDHKLGHGLGLVICKNIVEGYGGRIWAENLKPQGASFSFEIPLAGPA